MVEEEIGKLFENLDYSALSQKQNRLRENATGLKFQKDWQAISGHRP
jgi:hypothetical protein